MTVVAGGAIASAAPDDTSSTAVVDKSASPGTDLTHYPKLGTAPIDSTQWGQPTKDNSVVAKSVNADGSGTMTIYTPVQGESAATLYSTLQQSGTSDLQDPAASTSSSAARPAGTVSPNTANGLSSCRYGTAQTFLCGSDNATSHQVRWTDGCCGHPQVYFVDHTGSNWPVDTSSYVWNRAQGVDSIYAYGSCPGKSGTHCVSVTDRNAGCSGWQGLTTLTWNSSYYISTAKVELNDYNCTCRSGNTTYNYSKNANGYRQDACHEMGHALGMGHNSSTGSCLYGTIINSSGALQPNGNDFTLIQKLYADGD